MIKGCFGCVTDLFKIALGALIIIAGINYYSYRNTLVTIKSCYDGNTCKTIKGERIRLACIDTPDLGGLRADHVPAKAARDYLNQLVAGEQVSIRRISKDRYGRTIAEISKGRMNIQKKIVSKGYAQLSQRYAEQCRWSR